MKTIKALKIIAAIYSAAMLIWFAFPMVLGIFNLGNVTGVAVFGALLFYLIKTEFVHEIIKRVWPKLVGKIALIAASVLAVAVAATTVVLTVNMTAAAYKKPADDAVLIVLGCRVYGERPSKLLESRIDAAYEYLTENSKAVCVLSGGQGDDEDISEAECMRRELTKRGIAPDRIFMEDKSTSTRENMLFSKQIIDENGLGGRPIAIATNEFHQYRAQLIAAEYGMECGSVSGASELYLLPSYYVRELYGVLAELIA